MLKKTLLQLFVIKLLGCDKKSRDLLYIKHIQHSLVFIKKTNKKL